MGKHAVLVLGSGASKGAREDISFVPTGEDLLKCMTEWIKGELIAPTSQVNRIITGYAKNSRRNDKQDFQHCSEFIKYLENEFQNKECGQYPFESAMETLLDRFISKLGNVVGPNVNNELTEKKMVEYMLVFMCMYISPMGNNSFSEKKDGYDELISLLDKKYEKCSYVVLNYDVLLEQALLRSGFPFCYRGISENMDCKHDVYKINGSVNFFMRVSDGKNVGPLSRGSEIQVINGIGDEIIMIPNTKEFVDLYQFKSLEAKHPVVVAFEGKKRFVYNEETLKRIRYEADNSFEEEESELDILLCGLNVKNNEPGVSRIMEKIRKSSAKAKKIYDIKFDENQIKIINRIGLQPNNTGFNGMMHDLY